VYPVLLDLGPVPSWHNAEEHWKYINWYKLYREQSTFKIPNAYPV
jgi:hypothetical protein